MITRFRRIEMRLMGPLSAIPIVMAVAVLGTIAALPLLAMVLSELIGDFVPPALQHLVVVALGTGGFVGILALNPIYAIWLERKVAAHIQDRLGPMRVGWHGLLQSFADGVKLLFKEDLVPRKADPVLFRAAPMVAVASAFAAFAIVPWGVRADGAVLAVSNLNIGVLYFIAITSLGALSVLMAGWGSNNKYALYGGMRAAAQMVSYEIPTAILVLVVVAQVGSLQISEIVAAQQGGLLGVGDWLVFQLFPLNLIAFVLFFICGLAETNRTPFDIPEAESELVAGFHTEYSGMRFAFFFLAEYGNMLLVSMLAALLFLGGWHGPVGANPLLFFVKAFGLVVVQMWLRWTLPRLRVDQLMSVCWKYVIPISFFLLLATALIKGLA